MKKILGFSALAVVAVIALTATMNQAHADVCYYNYVLDAYGDIWRVWHCYY